MRRAAKPMPPQLWTLQFNPKSGFYEILEEGITYKMELEETRSIRDYYRHYQGSGWNDFPTVAGWYKDLKNGVKKLVIREGNIKQVPDGFFPDPDYQD